MNLVHKRLRTTPEFLPTLTISFCHSPSHTLYAALTWRPTATLDEITLGKGFVCSSDLKPQKCYVRNAIASGGLKWQCIAIIATFSSYRYYYHVVIIFVIVVIITDSGGCQDDGTRICHKSHKLLQQHPVRRQYCSHAAPAECT